MGYKQDTVKCEFFGTTFDCTWRILKKGEIWCGEYPKNAIYGECMKINGRPAMKSQAPNSE